MSVFCIGVRMRVSLIYVDFALRGGFPLWTAKPDHLVVGIVIDTHIVFETYAIPVCGISLDRIYLQCLRFSVE